MLLCGAFLAHSVAGELQRSEGIARAEATWAVGQATVAAPIDAAPAVPKQAGSLTLATSTPDQSLWSPSRIAAWEASAPQPVLAVLEMPSLGLEVPVFEGDMEHGPAWIAGTARPGEVGNAGISGHRDGYFRVLKDAAVGDRLQLRTAAGLKHYVVDDIRIVDPLDVEVLDPTDDPIVTLVTCYPFYYVGSAPQRYIVRARLEQSPDTAATGEL
ncbi:MAG: class D sortase [Halieaceae bacterium]|nr:class D sortase [Halieaceae bacterium]